MKNVQTCWSITLEKDRQGANHSGASVFSSKEKRSFPHGVSCVFWIVVKDQIGEMVLAALSPSAPLLCQNSAHLPIDGKMSEVKV